MTINVGDRPEKLTDEVIAKILHFAESDLLLNNAARCACVHEDTLKRWMELGKDDLINSRSTFLSRFYVQVREKQGKKISQLLQKIESCSKNWQALAWKLEKCFREDFGLEATEIKEFIELYVKLKEDYNKLKASIKLQGAISHGREMDSSSD